MRSSPSMHRLHLGRVIIATVVLGLLALSFFIQRAVFVWAHDVLAALQFFPSLWTFLLAGASSLSLGFVLILALTFAFGRLYCSFLCPLGIAQDGIVWISRAFGRMSRGFRRPMNRLRYAVLGVTVVLLVIGSTAAVNLFEPYGFFIRVLNNLAAPVVAVPLSRLGSAALQSLGIFVPPLSWTVNLAALATTAVLLGLLAALAAARGRLYCNSLCPVGAALSLVSRHARMGVIIEEQRCTRCGRCSAVCPAECIDIESSRVDSSRCVSCFRCLSSCPFDAVRYGGRESPSNRSGAPPRSGGCPPAQRRTAGGPDGSYGSTDRLHASRRAFIHRSLRAGAGLALLPAVRVFGGSGGSAASSAVIVPPGAVSVERFLSTCTACHLCVGRCPTRVLQPSLLLSGSRGVLQPRMDYRSGNCDFQCNVCSRICPSGALLPLGLQAKQETRIGTAEFVLERCVVFTNRTVCGACAEICPTAAVRMVPYRDGLTIPAMEPDLCIGCGSCEFVCPAVPRRAITVRGVRRHERIDLEDATRVEESEPGESEEGFAF